MKNRGKDGRFVQGNRASPGRPRGSRNQLSEDFLAELHRCFRKGGREALESMCRERPAEFIRVCASLIPRELMLEVSAEAQPTWVINARPALTTEAWVKAHPNIDSQPVIIENESV